MKKKKILIGGGIALFLVVGVGLAIFLFGKKSNESSSQEHSSGDNNLGITYVDVPDIDQVYINGQVQPEKSQAFSLSAEEKAEPVLKVSNGQIVEVGTVLYTLENLEASKQIQEQTSALAKQETRRQNTLAKWNRALMQLNQTKEDERTSSKAEIDNQFQADVDLINEEKQSLNESIATLQATQIQEIKADFKGKVSIPEVKEANTPILYLTSENFFVVGTVNEKDVEKIKPQQRATLTVVSNNQSVGGQLNAIDLNPVNQAADGNQEGAAQSMAQYKVKLSIDDLAKVKNGFHVQAAINIGETKPITLPKKAIHTEGELKYVLVNDFGSVIRRTVVTGEEKGEDVQIITGVESADRIIVSSKEPVKEGDILGDTNE